jgi:hypothetical protein
VLKPYRHYEEEHEEGKQQYAQIKSVGVADLEQRE